MAQYAVLIVSKWSVLTLLAIAVALPQRLTGHFDLSVAALFAMSPYIVATCLRSGLPLGPAMAVGLTLIGTLAIVVDWGVLARARSLGHDATTPLVASLGVYALLVNGLIVTVGSSSRTFEDVFRNSEIALGGALTTSAQLLAMATAISATTLLLSVLRWTRWGLTYRAIESNAPLADLVGVSVRHVGLVVGGLGAAIGGAASTLQAFDGAASPLIGFSQLLSGATCAILAGRGSWWRLVLTAAILALTEVAVATLLDGKANSLVTALAMVAALYSRARVARRSSRALVA